MLLEQLKQTLFSICAIQQGLRLYPAEHPLVKRQLDKAVTALSALTAEQGKLRIHLVDGSLRLNDIPCLDQMTALHELAGLFARQQLQSVDFLPGVDNWQLLFFCQELPIPYGGGLPQKLERAKIKSIRANLVAQGQIEPRLAYRNAVATAREFCHTVRTGQIPSAEKAVSTVKELLHSIQADSSALLAMTMLKDYDNYTFTHSVNVSVLAIMVGTACGLPQEELYSLGLGGLLHDLGKMTIDHRIVAKPGRLSREELEEIQRHPGNGAKIVAEMGEINETVVEIVNNHHLHYDRSGYPADSRGRHITPLADMVAIADTYDALTTLRSYQRPRSPKQALERMSELSGSLLHPGFLEKFRSYLGPYPVGTLVRLADGQIGLVCEQGGKQGAMVTLKILFDSGGRKLAETSVLKLQDSAWIVAEVDPALLGVRLEDYLDDGSRVG